MFNRAVTVFRQTGDGCEKTIITGVFYSDIRGISLESKGEAEACSIKVVIPLESVPKGLEIREGDFLCKGEVEADYANLTSVAQSESSFTVVSCDCKDYGSNPHLLIMGR